MNNTLLLSQFDLLATASSGVAKLRELILTLAVQGKLVTQDPTDEPASELLKRIRAEKDRLIAAGKIKRDKPLAPIGGDEQPFELPKGWEWVRWANIAMKIGDIDHKMPSEAKDGVPYVSPRDFYGINEIDFDGAKKIAYSDYVELSSKIRPEADDLIYPRYGTIGVVRKVTTDREFLASYSCAVIKVLRGFVEPDYQYLFSVSGCAKAQAASATNKTTQPNVGLKSIQEFLVPLPPLPEQARIVARVEELMRVCDALEAQGQQQAAHHRQLVQTLLGTLTDPDSATPTQDAWQRVAAHFDTLLDRPSAVDALEQTILQLAVRGQLVPQDPTDEPASELLKRIRTEKDRLIAAGKIKRDKPLAPVAEDEQPFALPVGWEWVRMGVLTSRITSGSRSWKDFYSTQGATFIRSQDIKHDRLEFDERAFVKLPPRAEGVRTQVQLQDLLITITGANVGKAAVVSMSMSMTEAYVSQHVALVRLHNVNLVNFLHLWLVSEQEGRRLLLSSSYGAKPGLNLQNINELFVPLPPIPEQARIVARVAHLRRLCAELRQRLTQSQTTQAALAGALVTDTISGDC